MNKIVIICGPTATGKTELGLSLAKKYQGEIISADSRQIFSGMDLSTGKGLPKSAIRSAQKIPGVHRNLTLYQSNDISIWGYDVITVLESFSAAEYSKIFRQVIRHIWNQDKLPIVVGGTGFYLEALLSDIPTLGIPTNRNVRNRLASLTVNQLQEKLEELDPVRFSALNNSDRNNPRRLVRAIEVAEFAKKNPC